MMDIIWMDILAFMRTAVSTHPSSVDSQCVVRPGPMGEGYQNGKILLLT